MPAIFLILWCVNAIPLSQKKAIGIINGRKAVCSRPGVGCVSQRKHDDCCNYKLWLSLGRRARLWYLNKQHMEFCGGKNILQMKSWQKDQRCSGYLPLNEFDPPFSDTLRHVYPRVHAKNTHTTHRIIITQSRGGLFQSTFHFGSRRQMPSLLCWTIFLSEKAEGLVLVGSVPGHPVHFPGSKRRDKMRIGAF